MPISLIYRFKVQVVAGWAEVEEGEGEVEGGAGEVEGGAEEVEGGAEEVEHLKKMNGVSICSRTTIFEHTTHMQHITTREERKKERKKER